MRALKKLVKNYKKPQSFRKMENKDQQMEE